MPLRPHGATRAFLPKSRSCLAQPMRDALPAANRTTPKTLHVSLPSRFRKPRILAGELT